MEEQFYLLWPAILVLMHRRKSFWIATALILTAPVIRVLSHLFLTGRLGPIESFMFHIRMDSLMFGCALAMVYQSDRFQGFAKRILGWPGVLLAMVFFLLLSGYLNYRFQSYYMFTVGYTLEGLAISYLLLYFVTRPESIGGRFLNSRVLVHIGLISYSLYLWQQLFLTDLLPASPLSRFPLNLILAFLGAELSWRFVEQPALRLRRRFEREQLAKPKPEVKPIPESAAAAPAEMVS